MLRKITIDKSMKCVSKHNNSQSEYSPKDFKLKTISNPKKQNKKLSQINEKLVKD